MSGYVRFHELGVGKRRRPRALRGLRFMTPETRARLAIGAAPYDHVSRYGYTARHMRCDCCGTDYLPQHVHAMRIRPRGWWLCDNCLHRPPRNYLEPASIGYPVESDAWYRQRRDRGVSGRG